MAARRATGEQVRCKAVGSIEDQPAPGPHCVLNTSCCLGGLHQASTLHGTQTDLKTSLHSAAVPRHWTAPVCCACTAACHLACMQAPAKPQKQHKRAASMQSLPETVAGPMDLEDAIGSRINALGDLEGATPHPELTPTCHSSALQTASEPQAAQAELPQQQVLQEKQGGPGALQQPADGERGGQPAEGREPPQQKAAPPLSQGSAHLEQLRNMYGLAQGEGPGSRPSILRAPQVGLLDTWCAWNHMLPMLSCYWWL